MRLPYKQINPEREIRERLKRIGIQRETGHEQLRGCVVFPLFNEHGQVVQVYGRRLDDGQGKASRHFYLPGPHRGLFNREAFTACEELILCESIIDALTFWCAGYRNVTTIYGTNGLTDEILEALKRHEIKRLLLAFDNDEARNGAVDKHAEAFTRLGIELFRIKFPAASKDANQYALQGAAIGAGNVHNWLGLVIRNADWLGKGAAPALSTENARLPPARPRATNRRRTIETRRVSKGRRGS